jgi:hypothetical protein
MVSGCGARSSNSMPREQTDAPARRARGEAAFPTGLRDGVDEPYVAYFLVGRHPYGAPRSRPASGSTTLSTVLGMTRTRSWPEVAAQASAFNAATYEVASIGDEVTFALHPRAAPAPPEGIDTSFAAEIVVAHDLQPPAAVGRTVRIEVWVAVEGLVQVDATPSDDRSVRGSSAPTYALVAKNCHRRKQHQYPRLRPQCPPPDT